MHPDPPPANPTHPGQPRDAQSLRDASRGQRLQRVLADAGVASRRACEQMIEGGRVSVNGQIVRALPAWVDPARDDIRVDGRLLPKPEPHLYIMLNKPARTLATPREGSDDARQSALDLVKHPLSSRLFPAGRLEFDATGLLLLTNDGDLAHRLTHARFGVEKTYQMVVRGTLDAAELSRVQEALARMLRRPAPPDKRARSTSPELVVISQDRGRTVLELTSRDAAAADVRDALAALGHPVKHLERVAIGPVVLRGVATGNWRELTREELSDLRRAAAGKTPRRGRAGDSDEKPRIAKRFRGIGKGLPGDAGAKAGKHAPPKARGGARRSSRGVPDANQIGPGAPVPASDATDARRGRGDAINAYRRKPAKADAPRAGARQRPSPAGKSRSPGIKRGASKPGSPRAGKGPGARRRGDRR